MIDKWHLIWEIHLYFYTRHMIVAGYYSITLAVHLSVHLSICPFVRLYFRFQMITWVNVKGFRPNLVFAEIWFGIVNGPISSIFDRVICLIFPNFHFWMITLVHVNGFSPNLVCALILWRSGLGLLIGKFRQFLTVICPGHDHIFISGWLVHINRFSPNLVCALHWYCGDLLKDC